MAGLDPAVHVDPRVKPAGDGREEAFPALDDVKECFLVSPAASVIRT
jgi:hypothetical protein